MDSVYKLIRNRFLSCFRGGGVLHITRDAIFDIVPVLHITSDVIFDINCFRGMMLHCCVPSYCLSCNPVF